MDGELAACIDADLSAVHAVDAQAATHQAAGAAVVVRCQKGDGSTLAGSVRDAHQEVAAAACGVGKHGVPAERRGQFDGSSGNQPHGGVGEGGIRVLPQPRPEPGGQQLLEGGGRVVGTVHQPVRERRRGSKRRALGLQFRIQERVIRIALVREVQQFSPGSAAPARCRSLP